MTHHTTYTYISTGAADAFDHHDKKATGLVALRNRALTLQRLLRTLPPSAPSPSVLPPVGSAIASAASMVETDLAIEALDVVQARLKKK